MKLKQYIKEEVQRQLNESTVDSAVNHIVYNILQYGKKNGVISNIADKYKVDTYDLTKGVVEHLKKEFLFESNVNESSVSSVGSVITPKGVGQLSTKNILKNIKTNAKYKPVSFGLDSATIEHLISGKRINITNKDLKNYEVVQ